MYTCELSINFRKRSVFTMNRNLMIASTTLGVLILAMMLPVDLVAETTKEFAGSAIAEQSKKIQGFLFGPAMRVAGVMGGAYGLIQAVLTSSVRPLAVYGGIGMGVNVIPKFIDGVYGAAGMLLP
jgi:hypothetical protein